jgi:DNA-binding NarL/FixJ family response regulator
MWPAPPPANIHGMGLETISAPGESGNESAAAILARLDRHIQRAELELRQLRGGYEALLKARLRASDLPDDGIPAETLTPRERRVAVLVAAGASNREVATQLDVSVHTVKSQVRSILRKLELHTRWQLADARLDRYR